MEMNEQMATQNSPDTWQGMEFLPVGICIVAPDFRICYWNACLEEWTGISPDGIVGTNLIERFPNLNKTFITERIDRIFHGGAPTIFSSQIHHYLIPSSLPDGTMRTQRTTVIPISSRQEGVCNAMIVCEDVSALTHEVEAARTMKNQAMHELEERIKAEGELKSTQEALLAYLIESASCVVHPVETIRTDLEEIIGDLDQGAWQPEEVRMQIQVEIGTIKAIEENLAELIEAATAGKQEIPEAFREFLLKKGITS